MTFKTGFYFTPLKHLLIDLEKIHSYYSSKGFTLSDLMEGEYIILISTDLEIKVEINGCYSIYTSQLNLTRWALKDIIQKSLFYFRDFCSSFNFKRKYRGEINIIFSGSNIAQRISIGDIFQSMIQLKLFNEIGSKTWNFDKDFFMVTVNESNLLFSGH